MTYWWIFKFWLNFDLGNSLSFSRGTIESEEKASKYYLLLYLKKSNLRNHLKNDVYFLPGPELKEWPIFPSRTEQSEWHLGHLLWNGYSSLSVLFLSPISFTMEFGFIVFISQIILFRQQRASWWECFLLYIICPLGDAIIKGFLMEFLFTKVLSS